MYKQTQINHNSLFLQRNIKWFFLFRNTDFNKSSIIFIDHRLNKKIYSIISE